MAGKPKPMSQVKQILRMHFKGIGIKSIKTIARDLQISKNTIKDYLRKVVDGKASIPDLLELEDPILEKKLFSGNPSYKDERYELLKNQLDYCAKELKKVGVTRRVLYDEYSSSQPDPYSYSQFCHHLQQHLKSSKPSMVLKHHPGGQALYRFCRKEIILH